MAKVPALVLVCLLLLAGAAQAADLQPGSRGPRVAAVQRWLGLHVDRVYGPATKRAVRRWQRRYHMHADGIVGTHTWAAMKRRYARNAAGGGATRVRSRGSAVRTLQRALGIAADGVFGPATQRAVKRFQRAHGLAADGVVGPATWAALGHPRVRVVLKRRGSAHGAGAVRRIVAAATRIAHLPYKYGGGHARWNDTGYDCSGSVSYALHGAGLLRRPLNSSEFMRWGAPGRGRHVTIYAAPGHAYMVVDGRRFDTTGRDESGSRWQNSQRSSAGYVLRHPPAL
jgi:hypothetical protein